MANVAAATKEARRVQARDSAQVELEAIFRGLNKIGPRTLRCGSRFWQKEEVILHLAKGGPKQIQHKLY